MSIRVFGRELRVFLFDRDKWDRFVFGFYIEGRRWRGASEFGAWISGGRILGNLWLTWRYRQYVWRMAPKG